MVATSPAPVKVNCLSWASATLRNPHAPAEHRTIAIDLQNSDTLSAWAEFVPPCTPAAPLPAAYVSPWGGLSADERNTRTVAACMAMFHDEPGNLPAGQVAAAKRTAIALTEAPDRTDVIARVRKAFAEAIAPVVTEPVAEPAAPVVKDVVENDTPGASSKLPRLDATGWIIGVSNAEFTAVNIAENDLMDAAIRAHQYTGAAAFDVFYVAAKQTVRREALRRVISARPVVCTWSADEPTCCPTCNDMGPYCPTCGVADPSPLDFTPYEPTPAERAWWTHNNPSNAVGAETRRSTRTVLDWPRDVKRTLPRERWNTPGIEDVILVTGCC